MQHMTYAKQSYAAHDICAADEIGTELIRPTGCEDFRRIAKDMHYLSTTGASELHSRSQFAPVLVIPCPDLPTRASHDVLPREGYRRIMDNLMIGLQAVDMTAGQQRSALLPERESVSCLSTEHIEALTRMPPT